MVFSPFYIPGDFAAMPNWVVSEFWEVFGLGTCPPLLVAPILRVGITFGEPIYWSPSPPLSVLSAKLGTWMIFCIFLGAVYGVGGLCYPRLKSYALFELISSLVTGRLFARADGL